MSPFGITPWVLILVVGVIVRFSSAQVALPVNDSAKTLGADHCAKCHQSEVAVWKKTAHYSTYRQLHRTPVAKQIAGRLGVRSIKRSETCTQCHYTQVEQHGRRKTVSGVSCESCHGPAADWISLHYDFGGPNVTRDDEIPAHKIIRRQRSIAAGMRNPSNVYLIARSCLRCHTTPNEEIVNVGGHPVGSLDFELSSWSQGAVRHRFLSTGEHNLPATPERRRVLYVVGLLADLEFSLRATAQATTKQTFGVTSALRANTRRKQLEKLQRIVSNPYVDRAVEVVRNIQFRLNNQAQLLSCADQIAEIGYAFATEASGKDLAAIDPLLPPISK